MSAKADIHSERAKIAVRLRGNDKDKYDRDYGIVMVLTTRCMVAKQSLLYNAYVRHNAGPFSRTKEHYSTRASYNRRGKQLDELQDNPGKTAQR